MTVNHDFIVSCPEKRLILSTNCLSPRQRRTKRIRGNHSRCFFSDCGVRGFKCVIHPLRGTVGMFRHWNSGLENSFQIYVLIQALYAVGIASAFGNVLKSNGSSVDLLELVSGRWKCCTRIIVLGCDNLSEERYINW